MITKGASNIRGVRSLKTRPGPVTETNGLLKLYQLAAEKDNLLKKRAWLERQRDQTEKRLAEIAHAMHAMEKTVEERAPKRPSSSTYAGFGSTSIQY